MYVGCRMWGCGDVGRGTMAHQVSNTIEKATRVRVCKTLFLRQSASSKVVSKGPKGNNYGEAIVTQVVVAQQLDFNF